MARRSSLPSHSGGRGLSRREFLALTGGSLAGLILVGCVPEAPQAPPAAAPAAPKAPPPQSMVVAFNRRITAYGNVGRRDTEQTGVVYAGLAVMDPTTYQWRPWMAEELPSVEKGTWKIDQASKTMTTTYRLRPNIKWHDGTPFSAKDFVFGWQVHADPKFPTVDRAVYNLISKMEAPNDRTLVIHWNALFNRAHTLDKQDIQHLPRHILEPIYKSGDLKAVETHPFWNRQFMGTGPYRIVDYGDGTSVKLEAFPDYFLGKPLIERLTMRIIEDANAALTAVLAGELDVTLRSTVTIDGALILKDRWEREGKGTVYVTPVGLYWLNLSALNPWFNDVRVRRALLHAIDREAIVKNLFAGLVQVAHAPMASKRPEWSQAEKAITKYEYNPQKAQQLLAEAGWRPGPDGVLVNAKGERFVVDGRAEAGRKTDEQVQAAVVDNWKRIGVEVQVNNMPGRVLEAEENRNRWPGARWGSHNFNVDEWSERWHSRNIPTAENRWVPENVSRWNNRRADAIMDELETIIPDKRREELIVEFNRLWTQDLPSLPLYNSFEVATAAKAITKLRPRSESGAFPTITSTIHEWGG